ncbi:hypothetical protein D347_02542, partial [Enterococcus faecalis LA3B-2]
NTGLNILIPVRGVLEITLELKAFTLFSRGNMFIFKPLKL